MKWKHFCFVKRGHTEDDLFKRINNQSFCPQQLEGLFHILNPVCLVTFLSLYCQRCFRSVAHQFLSVNQVKLITRGVIYWSTEDSQQQLSVLEVNSSKHLLAQKWQKEERKGSCVCEKQWCSDETISGSVLRREETGGKRRRPESWVSEYHSSAQFRSPEAAEVSIRLTLFTQEVKDQWSMGLLASWPGVWVFVCVGELALNLKINKIQEKI